MKRIEIQCLAHCPRESLTVTRSFVGLHVRRKKWVPRSLSAQLCRSCMAKLECGLNNGNVSEVEISVLKADRLLVGGALGIEKHRKVKCHSSLACFIFQSARSVDRDTRQTETCISTIPSMRVLHSSSDMDMTVIAQDTCSNCQQ